MKHSSLTTLSIIFIIIRNIIICILSQLDYWLCSIALLFTNVVIMHVLTVVALSIYFD